MPLHIIAQWCTYGQLSTVKANTSTTITNPHQSSLLCTLIRQTPAPALDAACHIPVWLQCCDDHCEMFFMQLEILKQC